MEIFNQEAIQFISNNILLFILILVWSLMWKGLALWRAARLSHSRWFLFILIVNTLGILEIIYIVFVAQKYEVENKESK